MVHVGAVAQPVMTAQVEQTRFDAVEQGVLSYCPVVHTPAHATQVSTVPSTR